MKLLLGPLTFVTRGHVYTDKPAVVGWIDGEPHHPVSASTGVALALPVGHGIELLFTYPHEYGFSRAYGALWLALGFAEIALY